MWSETSTRLSLCTLECRLDQGGTFLFLGTLGLPFPLVASHVACALSLIGVLLNGEMALAVPVQNSPVEVIFLVDFHLH